jgi:ribosomal protein L16 Arg81 hydroxylase
MKGYYSPIELDRATKARHRALRQMLVRSVLVRPGDALYIPAGWWHRVSSLDVSISFSLLNFRRPNDYSWYKPGHV